MSNQISSGAARRTMGARTGGRSERVVRDVLHAALAELARAGYSAMRVDDVASRAGVNKTTVYRRWPTKAELVFAAVRHLGASSLGDPTETGSVRGDLMAEVQRSLAVLRTPEGRAVSLLILQERDEDVQRLAHQLREEGTTRRERILERAEKRGELPTGVDRRMILDAIFAPIMVRALRFGEMMPDERVAMFIDLVITGVEHGAARKS